MEVGHLVESYKFWDVVTLWGRDRLEHEYVVARALARGVIRDGLALWSVDPKWLAQDEKMEFRGYPYVGYRAREGAPLVVLRATTLQHLLAVVGKATTPDRVEVSEEFIYRKDFELWLERQKIPLPPFWFE